MINIIDCLSTTTKREYETRPIAGVQQQKENMINIISPYLVFVSRVPPFLSGFFFIRGQKNGGEICPSM